MYQVLTLLLLLYRYRLTLMPSRCVTVWGEAGVVEDRGGGGGGSPQAGLGAPL